MDRVRSALTLLAAALGLLFLTPFSASAASPGAPDPTFGGGDAMAEVSFGSDGSWGSCAPRAA